MNDMMISYMNDAINTAIQHKLSDFAKLVSKRHDISLKLLLQDIQNFQDEETMDLDVEPIKKGQCMGLTTRNTQCKASGKHGGFCKRHVNQKQKKTIVKEKDKTEVVHVGHSLKERMFLKGCPACEKMKTNSSQNLLIEF